MRLLRRFCCLLLPLIPLLCTGCSGTGSIYANYRNIEELQLVDVIGLDFAEDGVTLSISAGNISRDAEPAVLSCRAASISEAMERIQNYTAREEFFYAHARYVILGETTAETSLNTILDYIERSPRMRPDTSLFILRDAKAADLMTRATDSEYNLANVLSSLEHDVELTGNGRVYTCAETAQALAASGSALVSAIAMSETEDVVFSGQGTTIAVTDGYAFLEDGRLRGFLNPEIAMGVNILQGHPGHTALTLEGPDGNPVTVQLSSAHTGLVPVWAEDGSLRAIDVSVQTTASVLELSTQAHLYSEPYLTALDQALAETLAPALRSVLLASRTYQADFLELGRELRLQDPIRFAQMPVSWDDTLGGIEFRLHISGKVDRTYSITDPADTIGKGNSNAET